MFLKEVARDVYGEVEVAAIALSAQKQAPHIMAGVHVQNTAYVREPYLILSPKAEDASIFLFELNNESDVLLCVEAIFRLLAVMHAEKTYHLEAKLCNFVFTDKVGRPDVNVHVTLSDGSVWYVYAIDYETMFMIGYNESQKKNFDCMCYHLQPYGYKSYKTYVDDPVLAERFDVFAMLVTLSQFIRIRADTHNPCFKRLKADILLREINPTGRDDHKPVSIPEATGGNASYSYFYVTGAPIKSAREIAALVKALLL